MDLDIYDHPYVRRLEVASRSWKRSTKRKCAAPKRSRLNSQEQLIELQRLTAIGQSQTLADFMLKARDWVLGGGGVRGREGLAGWIDDTLSYQHKRAVPLGHERIMSTWSTSASSSTRSSAPSNLTVPMR